MSPASVAAIVMPQAPDGVRRVRYRTPSVRERCQTSQINAACLRAACCRLVPLIPSHDSCAKCLLALVRFDVPATADDLLRRGRSLVNATVGQRGPDDARRSRRARTSGAAPLTVRQRDPHRHWWLARQHAAQPGAGSGRCMDMPPLRSCAKPLFAACRMLARRQPKPCRKVPAFPECLRRGSQRGDGLGGQAAVGIFDHRNRPRGIACTLWQGPTELARIAQAWR